MLASCYRNSLNLAAEHGFESIAFPLISSGIFGYPKEQALKVATETISEFLENHDMDIFLTVFGHNSFAISQKLHADVQSYIDDHYVEEHTDLSYERERRSALMFGALLSEPKLRNRGKRLSSEKRSALHDEPAIAASQAPDSLEIDNSLEDALKAMDESFSQMLLRKIDECGMKDAQCYRKANIDRKLFSKIRTDPNYKPSKATAIAFAVALELSLDETRELLMKAGYALSHSSKFDIIIEYFISRHQYDIFEINETLFAFDQSLLGSVG